MSKLRKSIFIAILLVLVCSITVYAAFTFSTRYSTNVTVGKVENATLTGPTTNVNVTFNNPGDSVTHAYSLANNDSKAYAYYYELMITNSTGKEINTIPDLANMVYVYMDDVYYGLLKDVVNSDNEDENELFLLPNTTRSNTFKFELHNGATGFNFDGATLNITIQCNLLTTNVQKYIYVLNETEFIKAVDDVNRTPVPTGDEEKQDKTIVLINDITINTELTIKKDSTIDLGGQQECVYDNTSTYQIGKAFRKAGVLMDE